MSKMKFKVYATNGTDIWEIIFISHNKHGDFYYGFIFDEGPHAKTSRHVSGKCHSKSDDNRIYQDHGKRQNLKEFKGFESLSCFGFSPESFNNIQPHKTYSGGKVDGSAFIDIRNYYNTINVNLFLIEPTKTEEISFISGQLENGQVIIFTQTTPWIVMTVCEKLKH